MLNLGRKTATSVAVAVLPTFGMIGGSTAFAATITDTAPVIHYSPDTGVDIYVPQFDAGLGTLAAVSVNLNGQFTPLISFDQAPPPSLSPVEFNPEVTLVAVFQGFNHYDIRSTQFLATEFAPIQSNQTAVGTPDAIDITAALPLTATSVSYAGSGDLDFYITGSSGIVPGYGSYVVNDANALTGQLAITYTYTPGAAVPEPASLALLGAGLLGLLIARARTRQSTRQSLPP